MPNPINAEALVEKAELIRKFGTQLQAAHAMSEQVKFSDETVKALTRSLASIPENNRAYDEINLRGLLSMILANGFAAEIARLRDQMQSVAKSMSEQPIESVIAEAAREPAEAAP